MKQWSSSLSRRLKLLLLLSSCLVMIPTVASAQSAGLTLTPSQQAIAIKFSIEPSQKYEGSSVIRAMDVLLTEAAAQDKTDAAASWDAGYKAAAVLWQPQADGWQATALKWRAQAEAGSTQNTKLMGMMGWGVAGALVLSAGCFIAGAAIF